MKKFKLLFVALCASFLVSLSSCEILDTRTYVIIQTTPSSTNYNYNTPLQYAVASRLSEINSSASYTWRNERDAIDWFYSVCDELESYSFTYGIPVVSGSTTTLKLIGDGDLIATDILTIRFYTNSTYI